MKISSVLFAILSADGCFAFSAQLQQVFILAPSVKLTLTQSSADGDMRVSQFS